jgi:inner membrane transporter RhtA
MRTIKAPGQSLLGRVPAQAYFGVSAVFHYLGPALAVLLFARLTAIRLA